jgi:invasion protein IalB
MGWLTRGGAWALLVAGALATSALAAASQDTNAQTDQAGQTDDQANQAAPGKQKQPIPWLSNCSAPARNQPLECAVEQRAFVRQSGRLIGQITIRVPPDTKKPVAMIQAPLGLFLPAGITVDVDGDMAQNYPLQTCNNNGCYAGFPVSDQMLNRMSNGGKLNIIFQYLDKKPFTLPMSLAGFKEAYNRIK